MPRNRASQQPARRKFGGFFYALTGHQITSDNGCKGTIIAQTPSGATFAIGSTIAAALTGATISNATEAVVTVTHSFAIGDIVEITSGWGRLNRRVFRVKSVSTTVSFVLEGMDTTSTTLFPAGGGTGSVRKITTFTPLTTVMSPSASGGDPKNITAKYIESDTEFMVNDGFAATSYSIELDADNIGNAGYTALKTLSEAQSDTALRITLRNGAPLYLGCTVGLNEAANLSEGQINKVKVMFNGNNRVVRYPS